MHILSSFFIYDDKKFSPCQFCLLKKIIIKIVLVWDAEKMAAIAW